MTSIHIDSKCTKCGGTITGDDGELVCINCGYRPLAKPAAGVVKDVKPEPVVEKRPADPKQTRIWFYKHKEEICKDIELLGPKESSAKWGYPNQMLAHFFRSSRPVKPAPAPRPRDPGNNGVMPHLPVFDNSWQPEVQLKWLDVWLASRRLT